MSEAEVKAQIEKLKHGEHFVVSESDYGRAEIWSINETLFLFSIPYLGGEPMFEKAFTTRAIQQLINTIKLWQ